MMQLRSRNPNATPHYGLRRHFAMLLLGKSIPSGRPWHERMRSTDMDTDDTWYHRLHACFSCQPSIILHTPYTWCSTFSSLCRGTDATHKDSSLPARLTPRSQPTNQQTNPAMVRPPPNASNSFSWCTTRSVRQVGFPKPDAGGSWRPIRCPRLSRVG